MFKLNLFNNKCIATILSGQRSGLPCNNNTDIWCSCIGTYCYIHRDIEETKINKINETTHDISIQFIILLITTCIGITFPSSKCLNFCGNVIVVLDLLLIISNILSLIYDIRYMLYNIFYIIIIAICIFMIWWFMFCIIYSFGSY